MITQFRFIDENLKVTIDRDREEIVFETWKRKKAYSKKTSFRKFMGGFTIPSYYSTSPFDKISQIELRGLHPKNRHKTIKRWLQDHQVRVIMYIQAYLEIGIRPDHFYNPLSIAYTGKFYLMNTQLSPDAVHHRVENHLQIIGMQVRPPYAQPRSNKLNSNVSTKTIQEVIAESEKQ